MGYAFIFIAALGAFAWFTPARAPIIENATMAIQVVRETIASGSEPLQARASTLVGSLRSKAMELLRKELHQSIDETVR